MLSGLSEARAFGIEVTLLISLPIFVEASVIVGLIHYFHDHVYILDRESLRFMRLMSSSIT